MYLLSKDFYEIESAIMATKDDLFFKSGGTRLWANWGWERKAMHRRELLGRPQKVSTLSNKDRGSCKSHRLKQNPELSHLKLVVLQIFWQVSAEFWGNPQKAWQHGGPRWSLENAGVVGSLQIYIKRKNKTFWSKIWLNIHSCLKEPLEEI